MKQPIEFNGVKPIIDGIESVKVKVRSGKMRYTAKMV